MSWRATGNPDDMPTEQFVAWTLERFEAGRMVFTTGFGLEGCALLDLYARAGATLRVVYLDTGFLFPETYALRDRLQERYPALRFERVATDLTPAAQAALFGPALWRRDPDRCCTLRKIEPLRPVLRAADVWITAITRHQGAARRRAPLIAWDWPWQILKVCPLVHWDRRAVWEYVRRHDVPHNVLHERGYPTIGCLQCTRAVPGAGPEDYSRAGRWAERDKTECGLHAARTDMGSADDRR
ncbi:MAG TPA: phosphoadenylyl-sulfate reductase [Gemmatimonadales bacterium]